MQIATTASFCEENTAQPKTLETVSKACMDWLFKRLKSLVYFKKRVKEFFLNKDNLPWSNCIDACTSGFIYFLNLFFIIKWVNTKTNVSF